MDTIAEDVDYDEECALIDAAAAPVHAIAEMVNRLPAHSGPGLVIKARAAAWFEGSYWDALRH